ncbi:hypothetical protein GGF43_003261 [Coemansia sp. RSA 2618]|nr:hypothetical protein GGF43_003261 [Coemansia sp. RSA 2618]
MVFYSSRSGTTLAYVEAMLSELAHKYPQNIWNYGVILSDSNLPLHCRVRINSEPVDSSLFKKCSHDYEIEVKARFGQAEASPSLAAGGLDAMLVNVALRIFEKQNVTTIAVSVAAGFDKAAESSNSSDKGHVKDTELPPDKAWSIERLIVELFRPKAVICGFEPLPTYVEHLPASWRSGLIYLMRHPVHVISATQPKTVRIQLHNLAKAFGVTIELSQALASVPACKDMRLGIFGADQHHYAALALSACQAWAYKHGLLRARAHNHSLGSYSASAALSPMRTASKQAPQSPFVTQIQSGLRDTPPWMLRGLCAASSPGLFYTAPTDDRSQANWHFSWAETPDDFSRTGDWFSGICSHGSTSPQLLLIHLPESFIKTVRFQRESDGQWMASDYREMLRSLYMPLRGVSWACCVFAADIMYESNVIESSVPPVLSQYVLREFWTQLSGMHTDQIFIAPSLASALRLIESKCATHMVMGNDKFAPSAEPPKAASPGLGSRSMFFEPTPASRASPTLKPTQLLRPSPSSSNLLSNGTRAGRAFSKSAMKSTTSIDNLSDGRPKLSFGLKNDSTASLPLRTPRTNAPLPPLPAAAIHQSNMDILVTGSRSFIQSTLFIAQQKQLQQQQQQQQ